MYTAAFTYSLKQFFHRLDAYSTAVVPLTLVERAQGGDRPIYFWLNFEFSRKVGNAVPYTSSLLDNFSI